MAFVYKADPVRGASLVHVGRGAHLENIRRHEAGAPLIGRVDRSRGY